MSFTHDTPLHDYYPTFIAFNLTHLCNYRCTYCPYHSKVLTQQKKRLASYGYTLTLDEFSRQVGALQRGYRECDHSFQVNFSGLGEPFMNKDLPAMMRLAAESGLTFGVVSNFSRLTTPHIEEMIDLGIGLIHTNLDGSDPATYEATRPGSKYHVTLSNIERTMACIARKNAASGLHLHYILTPENTGELSSFLDLMSSLGVTRVVVKMVVAMEYKTDGIFYRHFEQQETLLASMREARDKAKRLGITLSMPLYCQVLAGINERPLRRLHEQATLCYSPMDAMWVNFGPMHYTSRELVGNVAMGCPMRTRPEHYSWGNLLRDDLKTIINAPARVELMRSLQKNRPHAMCLTCEYQYLKIREIIAEKLAKADAACAGGAVALEQGRDGEAEKSFERALCIDPCHQEARAGLAVVRQRQGDREQAGKEAQKARAHGAIHERYAGLLSDASKAPVERAG